MSMALAGRASWLPLLSNRSFLALWGSRALTGIGEWVGAQVALSALVYLLTDDARMVALLQSIHAVPVLILAPMIGVLVDQWDRKTTLMAAHFVRGILFFTLVFTDDLPRILITYLFVNLAMLFFVPGTSAILPSLVGRRQLIAANSLTQTTSNVAMIFGASLGGAIIYWAGIPVALAVDGTCSMLAAAGIYLIQVRPHPSSGQVTAGRFWRELIAGGRYTLRRPIIGLVVVMTSMMAMGSGVINTMAIVFTRRALGAGATEYSMLLTACGVGALIGSTIVIGWGGQAQPHRTYNLGFALLAAAVIGISLSRAFPLALAGYFLAGLGQVGVQIMGNVMVQQLSDDEFLGRVFGLMQMVRHGASFLAVFVAGWFAEIIPVEMVLLITGGLMLASAASSFALLRADRDPRPAVP